MKAAISKPPKTTALPKSSAKFSPWRKQLESEGDAHALWRALQRLVSVHPLVRSALNSQQMSAQTSTLYSIGDLTQDLYLLLLEKGRFQYYCESQMTDAEIEREIFQIELTNYLIGRLRRRRPENYRMVRRVSSVLESDPQFRQYSTRNGQPARYRQAADAVYGLREWDAGKRMKDSGTFSDLIAGIPMRMRNRRLVGCRGEAQVIITNQELAELLKEIFQAIDSPAPLRVLRQLALTKLPVYDAVINSIDEEVDEERQSRNRYSSLASADASPEQMALHLEEEAQARQAAAEFLERLNTLMRSNVQRTERLWRVLWHCYFDQEEPSQLAVAEMVGISDSSVSDYRRKLEAEMRKLRSKLSEDQLRYFAEELDEQLRWRLSLPEKNTAPKEEFDLETVWPQYEYPPLAALEAAAIV